MVEVQRSAFKSFEIMKEGRVIRIDEGDTIQFSIETGEIITGILTKISGKEEKTKLQIVPKGEQKEEIWSIMVISEDTLTVIEDEED